MTKKRKKKRKGHQKFWRIKRHFFRKSLVFFRKSVIFSRNFPKTCRNLTLGFLGFVYCPILGFQFFLSGNTVREKFTTAAPQHVKSGIKLHNNNMHRISNTEDFSQNCATGSSSAELDIAQSCSAAQCQSLACIIQDGDGKSLRCYTLSKNCSMHIHSRSK